MAGLQVHKDVFSETSQVEGQAQDRRRIREEGEKTRQEGITMVHCEKVCEKEGGKQS